MIGERVGQVVQRDPPAHLVLDHHDLSKLIRGPRLVWVGDVPDVVGHAVVSVVADISELQRIAVDSFHRREGLATQLLDEVVVLARDEGADRLLLEVREDNHGAIAFYAARDFVEIDRRPRYYRDGGTAVVMRRGVGPACGGVS